MLKSSYVSRGLFTLFLVCALVSPLMAQKPKQSAEADRSAEAAKVLTEIMNIPEDSIPEELMARAHGIAVIPHVVKGAFGIGGSGARA
jgi:lipid-binding SYLF domain-containing protein